MKRLVSILWILIAILLEGIGQYVSEDITQIYTTPPTLSELGKYEDIPVGLYTGVPEISIPLYNVEVGNYKIPISLSYHASGIKVQQRASWVGLGWSLNGGGVITRVINGKADDRDSSMTGHYHTGLLYGEDEDYTSYSYWAFDHESDIYYFNFPGYSGKFFFDKDGNIHLEDDKPYQISFSPSLSELRNSPVGNNEGITSFTIIADNGMKCTFDYCERTTNITTYPNIVDVPYFAPSINAHGMGFQITDSTDVAKITNTTAWHLRKIEFPDRGDSITFEYDTYKYSNLERTGQARKWAPPPPMNRANYDDVWGCWDCMDNYLFYNYSLSLIDGYRLKKINWSEGSVAFDVEESYRSDMDTSIYEISTGYNPESVKGYNGQEKRLKEIIVKDYNSELRKHFALSQSYFFSDSDSSRLYNDFGCTTWSKHHLFYRSKLDSVYEISTTGEKMAPYTFEYRTDVGLPYRYSNGVDYWGYYNGKDGEGENTDKIPTLHIYPQAYFNYSNNTNGGIDTTLYRSIYLPFEVPRYDVSKIVKYGHDNIFNFDMGEVNHVIDMDYSTPGQTDIDTVQSDPADKHVTIQGSDRSVTTGEENQAFILNKIKYPTGGYTEFTYETNEYMLEGVEYKGGGVRISQMDTYDPLGDITITKTYSYDDINGHCSGRILSFPLFATNNWEDYIYNDFSSRADLFNYRYNQSSLTEGQWLGLNAIPIAPDNAYSEDYAYFFLWSINPENIIMHSASQVELGTTKGSYVGYGNVTIDYNGNGTEEYSFENSGSMDNRDSDTITYNHADGVIFLGTSCMFDGLASDAYPFAPNRNTEWNRGQLKTLHVYDSDENLLKRLENIYTIDTESYDTIQQRRISSSGRGNDHMFRYYKLSAWKYLSSQEETLYDLSTSNQITTTTKYTHNDDQLLWKQVDYGSEGDSIVTYTCYPNDYDSISGAVAIQTMQDANVINRPIEVVEMRNNKVTSAKYNKYTNNQSGIPLLDEIFEIEIDGPVDSSSFVGLTNQGNLGSGTYYNRKITLEHDEETYKLISASKEDDVEVSYIWGYNDNYPIAQTVNSESEESYHTSFEEGAGWTTWGGSYDSSVIHTGRQTRKITKPSSGLVNNFLEPDNWLDFRNIGAETYKFSGWVYSDGPIAQLFLFKKTDLDKTNYYSNTTANYEITETRDKWVYLEIEAEIAADVNYVYFRLDSNGESSGSVWFDDIRFHPADAQMTTYTYDPLVGMTSQTDPNGLVTSYEYDSAGRLIQVKDHDGNILEEYDYHYANQ